MDHHSSCNSNSYSLVSTNLKQTESIYVILEDGCKKPEPERSSVVMADCHDALQEFSSKITLSSTNKEALRNGRKALRNKIRKHFQEILDQEAPKFKPQGSFAMGTIINPIKGEYDLDDGVYLTNLDEDSSKWPTAETVHNWIVEAVKNHTSESPIDKRTCVRVVYSGNYHIDLPIYGYNEKTDAAYLAEKGQTTWPLSDPGALNDWFRHEVDSKGNQLRKTVKYIKAWADNKSSLGKLPCSLALTVLTVNNYQTSDRDDIAVAETARSISNQLAISTIFTNPVNPAEVLSDKCTESQMDNLEARLSDLVGNADKALREEDETSACERWQREFGDRFPSPKSEASKAAAGSVILSDPPKPWNTSETLA